VSRTPVSRPYAHIRTSVERHVAWIEFNRPPVNAFTRPMVDETYDAIAAALADPDARVLVLASAVEGYFSAGADLHTFKGLTPEGVRDWAKRCHELARLLRGSAKPLLAAIQGTAVGGGLEMTLHCDVRFAATGARFGQPEIRIGFYPADRHDPGAGPPDRPAARYSLSLRRRPDHRTAGIRMGLGERTGRTGDAAPARAGLW